MDIPYTVKVRPDTGVYNAKIAIWLFLASEVMLFGGLFSAYIFLRIASDTPWPTQVLDVKTGFINTLILIFSSITVLQAWLSLKMRNYGRYQLFMVLTLICSVVFMFNKFGEYQKKFHHYGIKLQDDSIVEGHFKEDIYKLKFTDVTKITLDAKSDQYGIFGWTITNPGADEKFLSFVTQGEAKVKNEVGEVVSLDQGFISKFVKESRKAASVEEAKTGKPTNFTKALELAEPLSFSIPDSYILSSDANGAVLKDGTIISGKLADDKFYLIPDFLDLRRLIPASERNLDNAFKTVEASDLWNVVGKEHKDAFLNQKAAVLKRYADEGKEPDLKNVDFSREAFTIRLPHDAAAKEIVIEEKDVSFYSNFTPKYHNFYAIYFAITSLHGIHIIGGAIVLAYFLLFDKKIYMKDPEHLANRVEVGGLFWHFVDVVWMIVFPVLYLM